MFYGNAAEYSSIRKEFIRNLDTETGFHRTTFI